MKVFASETPRDHLILPDRQAFEGCGNEVDHAVGNYIVKHRPAVIVDLGDHADMPSLSSYDIGKKSYEGRRYKKDIEASIHANEIQWKPLFDLQARQRRGADKVLHNARLDQCFIKDPQNFEVYLPLRVMIIGNHENRINRVIDNDPKLDGLISIDDLQYDRFFDHVSPFLEPVMIDGVNYVHYAYKTLPHKAIEGEMQARTILKQQMVSTTVGHSPVFHYFETFTGNDHKIQCMVAGMRGTHEEGYAGARNRRYWRGIVHKYEVIDGRYDFEKISVERLLKNYL